MERRRRFRSGMAKRRAGRSSCRKRVSQLRIEIIERPDALDLLMSECGLDRARRGAGGRICAAGAARAGRAAVADTVVAERSSTKAAACSW